MKKKLFSLIVFVFFSFGFAQNGINYKALIKDDNGNAITNQAITIQFQILADGITNVYQETHNPTTDANGIIIVNIGEGTVDSGDFSTINWGVNDHFLNIQIDSGSGLVDLGTTQFKSVPYAKVAETATSSADNTNFSEVYLNGATTPTIEEKSPDLLIKLDTSSEFGTSIPIDQQKFLNLCGDDDGCSVTVRLIYPSGSSVPNLSNAVTGKIFYKQDPNNASRYFVNFANHNDASTAIDGDNFSTSFLNAFGACMLTDGTYTQTTNNGDNELGISFLYWTNYSNNKECICKIED